MTGLEFVPLTEARLRQLHEDSEQRLHGGYFREAEVAMQLALLARDHAEVMLLDGQPVMAAGLWLLWPGRAEAWMLTAADLGNRERMHGIMRGADRMAQWQKHPDYHRIELWMPADAPHGAATCIGLGMHIEGTARCWYPDGSDATLWARIAGET
jgi:hypothetical protein